MTGVHENLSHIWGPEDLASPLYLPTAKRLQLNISCMFTSETPDTPFLSEEVYLVLSSKAKRGHVQI